MSGALSMLMASAGGSIGGIQVRFAPTLQTGNSGNTYGYNQAGGYGAVTPSNQFTYLGATITLTQIVDRTTPSPASFMYLAGFNSDPGYAAIYSVQWGVYPEVVYTGGSANYIWDVGTKTGLWTFSTTASPSFGFALSPLSTSYTLTIKG